MECELNGSRIKYDDGKVWVWREMRGKQKLKNPDWFELKGCDNKYTGYNHVRLNKKLYLYHRVKYFIHNQEWNIHNSSTDNSIDHIDRNRLNNSIENLRVVTQQQNQWNRDGKGYCLHKQSGKYRAKIQVDGKNIHLGMFEKEDDARNAYLEAKAEYHSF
tara:strand:+ start:28 stop:507 length:480 start_codon:yes stop_codon:yes gene_type:complete